MLTMPEPRPVALVGDLLATQAKAQGAAGMLIDASVRDVEELASWACRSGRGGSASRARPRTSPGRSASRCTVGGATIRQGDIVVLDADGVAVVEAERVDEVLGPRASARTNERVKRAKLQAGELSYDLDGLRERVEGA